MDDFDYDDGDKFMEDSIKEAQAEVEAKRKNNEPMDMQAQIKKLESESSMKKTEEEKE